ncbi:hypothetical protein, partial [Pseudomonas syringae group genomosp. 7]|uniref:hypothetical protein n=1 Tax=Pseudomonas syringae group genomosp. 7 TaxID=251699 RepID=UPI00376F6D29
SLCFFFLWFWFGVFFFCDFFVCCALVFWVCFYGFVEAFCVLLVFVGWWWGLVSRVERSCLGLLFGGSLGCFWGGSVWGVVGVGGGGCGDFAFGCLCVVWVVLSILLNGRFLLRMVCYYRFD